MRIKNKLHNKKGFTLTELCVVMAILAIVGTMVVTFMIFMSNQQAKLTRKASRISNISQTQKVINEWIRSYDTNEYQIQPSPDTKKLVVYQGSTEIATLYFSDGSIYHSGAKKTDKLNDISDITFSKTSSVSQKLIQAKVSFKETSEKEQILLFAIYSGISRDRSVIARNG